MRPDVIIDMPALGLLLIALAFAAIIGCGGQWYVHRRFPEEDFARHNEVGAVIIAIAGTLYSVLLGFLTVASWQHFAEARELVGLESAATADAWHMAVGLPSDRRRRVRSDLLAYAQLMVTREWPLMRTGGYEPKSDVIVMDAIATTGSLKPADLGASNAQSATLAQLGILHDVRQRRLSEESSEIGPFLWFVLIFGALCITCFCWLFGAQNRRVHLLMTSCVAIMVTLVLVLLFELQYPFRTGLRIGPDDWNAVIAHITTMRSGTQPEMRM